MKKIISLFLIMVLALSCCALADTTKTASDSCTVRVNAYTPKSDKTGYTVKLSVLRGNEEVTTFEPVWYKGSTADYCVAILGTSTDSVTVQQILAAGGELTVYYKYTGELNGVKFGCDPFAIKYTVDDYNEILASLVVSIKADMTEVYPGDPIVIKPTVTFAADYAEYFDFEYTYTMRDSDMTKTGTVDFGKIPNWEFYAKSEWAGKTVNVTLTVTAKLKEVE